MCHYCYKPHRLLTADTQHSTQLNFVLRFIKRVILLMNDPCCVYSCTYIHERTRGLRMGYDTEQKFSKLISSLKCNLTRWNIYIACVSTEAIRVNYLWGPVVFVYRILSKILVPPTSWGDKFWGTVNSKVLCVIYWVYVGGNWINLNYRVMLNNSCLKVKYLSVTTLWEGNILLWHVATFCCDRWKHNVVKSGNILLWQVATFCCDRWQHYAVKSGNILLWQVATLCCEKWQHSVVTGGNILFGVI